MTIAPLFLGANKFAWAVNAAGFFYGMKPFWETRGDMREYLAMQDEIEDFQEYYEDDEEWSSLFVVTLISTLGCQSSWLLLWLQVILGKPLWEIKAFEEYYEDDEEW